MSGDDESDPEQLEDGPSWEHIWFHGRESEQFPADLRSYGPEAYGAYWEKWLAEVIRPPPPGYYYIQNDAILSKYDARNSEKGMIFPTQESGVILYAT